VNLTGRLLDLGGRPEDTKELRELKQLQLAMTWSSVPTLLAVAGVLSWLGRNDALIYPLGYVGLTLLVLGIYALTKHHGFFRETHTLIVLLLPLGLHWHLGGFAGSGGWLLWCVLAPVAALMFVGPRRSYGWFAAWVCVIALAALREGPLAGGAPLTKTASSAFFCFNVLGVSSFMFLTTRQFVERLETERARSETLLLNVLPAPIAERLKREEGIIADRFEQVTVLFSDLVGFTKLAQRLSARELVELLNEVFSEFDELAAKHGLEKIKTIGDAYMLVGGLPVPRDDHARAVAAMAGEMVEVVQRFARDRDATLSMRIGIHSGEVVAGVIGLRKFTYDLWGDTVNVASRMESHGEPERIHLSQETAELLQPHFELEERGVIEVKGKGPLKTFWLLGAKG
jgi:adenylate cyclase